jgi:hypothetical protein
MIKFISMFGYVAIAIGDRKAESRVDDRLLIPFRQFFGWSEPYPSTNNSRSNGQQETALTNNNKLVRLYYRSVCEMMLVYNKLSCC